MGMFWVLTEGRPSTNKVAVVFDFGSNGRSEPDHFGLAIGDGEPSSAVESATGGNLGIRPTLPEYRGQGALDMIKLQSSVWLRVIQGFWFDRSSATAIHANTSSGSS